MGLSLRELKEYLIEKGGYTITPNHNQLSDLKALVDDMMNIRSESPPATGSGYYSGTTCNGHVHHSDYNLSLGDIYALDIKGCSCYTVNDRTAYCKSRTYYCSCNSNIPVCDCNLRVGNCSCNSYTPVCSCNTRTYSCSCNSNVPICTCNSRTPEGCDCRTRGSDMCIGVEDACGHVCYCHQRTISCSCDLRTSEPCDCQSRTSSCGSRNISDIICGSRTADCGTVSPAECTCVSRTSSCGSRDTTSCTCNGRCACNSEKRFS